MPGGHDPGCETMIITDFAVLHLYVKMSSAGSEHYPYSDVLGGSIPPLGCRWYFLRYVSCDERDTKVLQEARAFSSSSADKIVLWSKGDEGTVIALAAAITTRPE